MEGAGDREAGRRAGSPGLRVRRDKEANGDAAEESKGPGRGHPPPPTPSLPRTL